MRADLKSLMLALVIISLLAIAPFTNGGPPREASALLDGTQTECPNLYSIPSPLGIIFDIVNANFDSIGDATWTLVDEDAPFQSVSGKVISSHPEGEDFPFNHDSHDVKMTVTADEGQEDLISTANRPGTMVIEWEHGIRPSQLSGDGFPPIFPKWAWPSVGDRLYANGYWAFDCGHPKDSAYRSEIHPARAIASMRDQVWTLPGTGTTPVRVTATDLYIHGNGGFAAATVTHCPFWISGVGFNECDPDYSVPIDDDYEFYICLPPKPSESAQVSYFWESGPGDKVPNIAPDLRPVDATDACLAENPDSPTSLYVKIPLEGTGVKPEDVYAKKIFAGWVYPFDELRHFTVTLNKMDLHNDHDPPFFDCECTFFWLNEKRTVGNEWIRMADFDVGDTMDSYDSDDGLGDGVANFEGADFDFYVGDGSDFNLFGFGYDADCFDQLLTGIHIFSADLFALCYIGTFCLVQGECGAPDEFLRTNVEPRAENNYQCPPENTRGDPIVGNKYILCTNISGGIRVTPGFWTSFDDGVTVIPLDEYDLYFGINEMPLTVEDTANLSIAMTCTPGILQSFDCTITVNNIGPGLPRNVVVQYTLTTDAAPGSFNLSTPKFTIENSDIAGPFSCTVTAADKFECQLGTVPIDGKATITFTVTASQPGTFENTAIVTTDSTDPESANDEGSFKLIVVDTDVKPSDSKNTISLNNDKSVRVAVLASTTLAAGDIDFSPLSDAPKFGGSTPKSPVSTNLLDVNNDGRPDLVLKYNSGPKNPLGFKSGDSQGCLIGKLTDGTLIIGCDPVRTIK